MASRTSSSSTERLATKMAKLSTQHGRERREAFEAAWHEGIRNAQEKRHEQEKLAAEAKLKRQKEELANFFRSVVMTQIENAARSSYTNTNLKLSGTRWICRSWNGDDTPTWNPTSEANELQAMLRDNGFTVASEIVFTEATFSYSVSADIIMKIKWDVHHWEDSSEEDASEEDASEEDSQNVDKPITRRTEERPGPSVGRAAADIVGSTVGMIMYGIFLMACFGFVIFLLGSCLESCLDQGHKRSSFLLPPQQSGHVATMDQIRTKT